MEDIKYFETIKCDDYEIFNLDYHNKRIANTIGLNIDLQEYIYPTSADLLRCKVIYNQYEILDVQCFAYEKREINSFKLVFDDEINYSKKYLNRDTLDKLYEKKDDCDEVIIIKNGVVTDSRGYFEISAKISDTLQFSAVNLKARRYVLTTNDFSKDLVFVKMEALIIKMKNYSLILTEKFVLKILINV